MILNIAIKRAGLYGQLQCREKKPLHGEFGGERCGV